MAKRKNSDFSLYAVKAWFRVVSWLFGNANPSVLERRYLPDSVAYPELSEKKLPRQNAWSVRKTGKGAAAIRILDAAASARIGDGKKSGTRTWRAYKEGRHFPSLVSRGKKFPTVVERVEADYPGSSDWLLTPFWRLFEDEPPSLERLVFLIAHLPKSYRTRLVATHDDGTIGYPATLLPVSEVEILWLALRSGPWALGALACIVRMAQLSGNSPLQRNAIAALLWMLWTWRHHAALSADFAEIWPIVAGHLQDTKYSTPDGTLKRLPITNADLKRIDKRVKELKAERRQASSLMRKEVEALINESYRRNKPRTHFSR